MSALGKSLFLLLISLVQGAVFLFVWDGETTRLGRIDDFVRGEATIEDIVFLTTPYADRPDPVMIPLEFYDLVERDYPGAFAKHFDVSTTAPLSVAYTEARDLGKAVYIREGCFHCHTQYVRPESRDMDRWGAASLPSGESLREVGLPLWGLRRVGPDLANESGRRSNDWHAAHLMRPQSILKRSVMPGYPWLFEESEGRVQPNREGLALIIFLQSLGPQSS